MQANILNWNAAYTYSQDKTERSIEYIKIFNMTKVESPTVTLRHFPV